MKMKVDEEQTSQHERASVAGEAPDLVSGLAPFTVLNQELYKDDNGRDVPASMIEYVAPYLHTVDGFYKWECGKCRHQDNSRSCGWPIAGQVLKCDECGARNLLVKTNTVQLDELTRKKNSLDLELERLASDRAAFDREVQQAAKLKISLLEAPLRRLLTEIETQRASQQKGTSPTE